MQFVDLEGRLTVTVPEAGVLLGLSRGSAYAAAHRGEIPTLRLGHRLLVPVPRLLELVGHLPDGARRDSISVADETAA